MNLKDDSYPYRLKLILGALVFKLFYAMKVEDSLDNLI
jgi:hypothetical protein